MLNTIEGGHVLNTIGGGSEGGGGECGGGEGDGGGGEGGGGEGGGGEGGGGDGSGEGSTDKGSVKADCAPHGHMRRLLLPETPHSKYWRLDGTQ